MKYVADNCLIMDA